ncbi:MAG: ATP-binding protein [Patescibacteria group bacterium]
MSNETRINLKHLLEDIRDSYSSPIEEVIITELAANSLDSGATRVDFIVDYGMQSLTCLDNGRGMTRAQFREYHNIASSSKIRGQGIGFAGVGAKLALLLASEVITETKGPHGGRCASLWKLASPHKAPWKYRPSTDIIKHRRGTSVSVFLTARQTKLLDEKFIAEAIVKHFYSLLNRELHEKILRYLYKKGVEFYVNGRLVALPEDVKRHNDQWFEIKLGKQRRPVGFGFLALKDASAGWLDKITGGKPAPLSLSSGLTISTYGKVIKSGWEWVGIAPKSPYQLVGIVEVPAMSELLTTNKDNFLSDSASLKKYYRYRKAIQAAILPTLKYFGEDRQMAEAKPPQAYMKPLSRQIEGALDALVVDFPELASVIASRSAKVNASEAEKNRADGKTYNLPKLRLEAVSADAVGPKQGEKKPHLKTEPDESGEYKKRVKKPGLKIALEPFSGEGERDLLGRVVEDTVYINTGHPSWPHAVSQRWEEYHVVITVALILYDFVEAGGAPQEFVGKFLRELSEQQKSRTLF